MEKHLDITIKRSRGYWFIDGFTEIALGGLLVLLAAFLLFSIRMSQAPFLSWFLSVTGEIAILKIVSFLVVVLIVWWLKDHFTYPRTGFVRGKITGYQFLIFVRNVILFLLLPIAGLLIVSTLATSTGAVLRSMPIWFPIGLALIWGIFVALAGEWLGLLRFRWIGGMILLAGIAAGFWQLAIGSSAAQTLLESINRTLNGLGLVMLISGFIFACSGILTFMRYRKENPEPYREDA